MGSGKTMANKVLRQYWNGCLAVDVAALARNLGVVLQHFQPEEGVRGRLDMVGNQVTIFYNPANSRCMNRFVVAHLLGRYLLGHGVMNALRVENLSTHTPDEKDQQANEFALSLLIPVSALDLVVKRGHCSSFDELCQMFGVSEVAMGLTVEKEIFSRPARKPKNINLDVEENIMLATGALITGLMLF